MYNSVTSPHDLLLLLYQYHYLTINQVVNLLDKKSTITNIREKLKKLVDGGLVETQCLPRTSPSGKTPYVYSLTKKGRRSLIQADVLDTGRKSGVALEHTLAINDVAILCQTVDRTEPCISLAEMRLESVLKTHPLFLPERGKGKEKKNALVPDLFARLHLLPPFTTKAYAELGIFFEIDRGTELDPYTIQEKLQKYLTLSYTDGLYEHHFGLEALLVVFVVTSGGIRRVRQLVSWARQEFKHTKEDAELFLFGACEPATLDAVSFFTDAMWQRPYVEKSLPLLEKKTAQQVQKQFQPPFFGSV